ncbi:MAG: cupin domain-containing protein [Gammaproteobacteria bacterium]|nr:cupin domain-containing protein [Gammaproteobacteria bacterium]
MTSQIHRPAIDALLTPTVAGAFLRDAWPGEVFATHNAPTQLPEFLRNDALCNYGELIQMYGGRVAFTNSNVSAVMTPADPQSVPNLPQMGLTVFLEDVTACIPGAEPFVRQLEVDLGLSHNSIAMSAWISPGDNGVACHYDPYDTFSIHLAGAKTWELAKVEEVRFPTTMQYSPGHAPNPELYPQMAEGFPHWEGKTFQTVEMRPGSVMYFPRGTWHRTRASSPSIALTLVLKPPNAMELLLGQLRLLLLQDADWREPLYGAWGDAPASAHEKVSRLLDRLPATVRGLTVEHLLSSALSAEQQLLQMGPETRFQRKPHIVVAEGQAADIAPEASQWVELHQITETGDREFVNRLEIPRLLVDVIEHISQASGPLSTKTLGDAFPQVPPAYLGRLLELCVRAGLLDLLEFPALRSE